MVSIMTVIIFEVNIVAEHVNAKRIRLPDVLERQGLSLNLLSKLILSLILENMGVLRGGNGHLLPPCKLGLKRTKNF